MILKRATIFIEGRVQGVGFRPFVFRYAKKNNLKGFVCNTSEGVYIEAEGNKVDIEKFISDIKNSSPKQSIIKKITITYSPPLKKETGFVILESRPGKKIQTELSPDIATCKKCLKELFNPEDRRFLFPFINCTDCLLTVLTADQGLPSQRNCLMTGRIPQWLNSGCVLPVSVSITTSLTDVFMHSRTAALPVDRSFIL